MSVKSDLMKQINAAVQHKKALSKTLTRDKTIATWVSDFFAAVEKTRDIDQNGNLGWIEVEKLANNLHTLDRRARVYFSGLKISTEPQIDIHWSSAYITQNNCEPVTVMTAASAFFDKTIEE